MRKTVGVLAVLFLCLLPFGQTWADSDATVTAETDIGINQDFSDHGQSSVTTIEKRPHIYAPPGTGVFVLPPSTLDEGGWKTMMYEPLLKEFTYDDLNEVRIKSKGLWRDVTKNYLKKTVFHSRVASVEKKWIDKVVRLDWYPTGSPEIGEVIHKGDMILGEFEIIGQKKWTSIAPLLLGILEAMEETYAKRIVVQLKLKKEAYNAGFSVGSGTAAGAMMGSSGKADDKAGFVSLGGLIGKTWAGMWSAYDFRILALNDGKVEPPAKWWELVMKPKPKEEKAKPELDDLNKSLAELKEAIKDLAKQAEKPTVIKVETPPPPPPVVIAAPPPVKPEPKPEKIELPEFVVYFDFDKSDIKPEYQSKIKEMAIWLVNHPGFKCQTEGHACNIGSVNYNAGLARRRAKAVYDAFKKTGGEIITERIEQFVSLSEDKPAIESLPENRRVIIRVIGPASGK
jgi:outer membrane protein OmpA-like peptidoglycan-associated protein